MFQDILQWVVVNNLFLIGAFLALVGIGVLLSWLSNPQLAPAPAPAHPPAGAHGHGHHRHGRLRRFKDLHHHPIRLLIWLWAESGPIVSWLFVQSVGVIILGALVWCILKENPILFFGALGLFGYYLWCRTSVATATWWVLTIGDGRLKTTMVEGPRLLLKGLMKKDPYSGAQEAISVEGHADLRDGSIQRYKGTISIIRDRFIVDASNRPLYPEADKILKAENGLPDRFKQTIEIVMSFCTGDDLLKRDEAVKLALSSVMRLRIPPHMTAGPGGTALPSDEVIDYYDTHKAYVVELLHHEVHSVTDVEAQFAVRVVETGITFDPDFDLIPAQQAVRKTELFVQGQQILEGGPGGTRMTPAESRQVMKVLGGSYTGTIVETGGSGAGGGTSDPFGLIAGMSMLASALKGNQQGGTSPTGTPPGSGNTTGNPPTGGKP